MKKPKCPDCNTPCVIVDDDWSCPRCRTVKILKEWGYNDSEIKKMIDTFENYSQEG